MKTELEKKLNKLPAYIRVDQVKYYLQINKVCNYSNEDEILWNIEYIDINTNNSMISVIHQSLQAAVDNALKEIKSL